MSLEAIRARLAAYHPTLIAEPKVADAVVIDPRAAWTPTPDGLRSLGKNTPLLGRALIGRVVAAVVDGELRLDMALA